MFHITDLVRLCLMSLFFSSSYVSPTEMHQASRSQETDCNCKLLEEVCIHHQNTMTSYYVTIQLVCHFGEGNRSTHRNPKYELAGCWHEKLWLPSQRCFHLAPGEPTAAQYTSVLIQCMGILSLWGDQRRPDAKSPCQPSFLFFFFY